MTIDGLINRYNTTMSSLGFDTPRSSVQIDPEREAEMEQQITPTIPRLGSRYMIICPSSGRALMLRDGEVVLEHANSDAAFIWECECEAGYFGFKNTSSGNYLGSDKHGMMRCSAPLLQGWEFFVTQPRDGGTYVLQQPYKEDKWKLVTIGTASIHRLNTSGASKKEPASVSDPLVVAFYEIKSLDLPEYVTRIQREIYWKNQ